LSPEYGTLPYTINSNIVSGIAPIENTFKFKIAPNKAKIHRKKNDRKMAPLSLGQRGPVLKHT